MNTYKNITLPILIVLLLYGCGNTTVIEDKSGKGDPVYNFAQNDHEMNEAIGKARQTITLFINALKMPDKKKTCILKIPIDNEGRLEHIWIDEVTYDGQKFSGKLANNPISPKYKIGDKVTIDKDKISDWAIFYRNGRHDGGYTIEVIKNRTKN